MTLLFVSEPTIDDILFTTRIVVTPHLAASTARRAEQITMDSHHLTAILHRFEAATSSVNAPARAAWTMGVIGPYINITVETASLVEHS